MPHNKIITIGMIIIIVVLISMTVSAVENRPVQISLFTPIQIFPESDPVGGLRINFLYGRSSTVVGLDFGLVNHATTGMSMGYQLGMVGLVDADFKGFQSNLVNYTKGYFEGFQWGLFNHAGNASGFQLGIVNYAQSMHGLQIGLVNIIKQGGQFPVFPIVNWSF